jgi:hypothetical protein
MLARQTFFVMVELWGGSLSACRGQAQQATAIEPGISDPGSQGETE